MKLTESHFILMTSSSNLSETHHNAAWGTAWTALAGIGEAPSFAAIKESLPKEKR
ncbi:hypothetical protein JYK21_09325 [Ralstonia pickettii]|nr:hypothetical protein [Ralstonia pickettii]